MIYNKYKHNKYTIFNINICIYINNIGIPIGSVLEYTYI